MKNNLLELVGKKFGELTVLAEFSVPYVGKENYRSSIRKLVCRCTCGNINSYYKTNVTRRKSFKCCHCAHAKDLTNTKIGKFFVEKKWFNNENRTIFYSCVCKCGNHFDISSGKLRRSKGTRCDKCPKKIKHTRSRSEAIRETNKLKHERAVQRNIGRRFGLLKITGFAESRQYKNRKKAYYYAKCKCGNIIQIPIDPAYKSCGCTKNYAKGERANNAALKNEDAKTIRDLYNANVGYTARALANMFGVSETAVRRLLANKSYKEV